MFTNKNPLGAPKGFLDEKSSIFNLFIVCTVVGSFLGDMNIMRM